ncbi:hypothetical protein B0J11DRAFT_615619 [Dendryphion nanum]|uniref:Uncharacterized protein n=1 Tax=Dendryphion nanum TaxID=256645 RepID=A0A9P9ILZ4_9PLEO|nr:hypothetical protein B0J11DRAFT_615619 [Dendryphion nanum]
MSGSRIPDQESVERKLNSIKSATLPLPPAPANTPAMPPLRTQSLHDDEIDEATSFQLPPSPSTVYNRSTWSSPIVDELGGYTHKSLVPVSSMERLPDLVEAPGDSPRASEFQYLDNDDHEDVRLEDEVEEDATGDQFRLAARLAMYQMKGFQKPHCIDEGQEGLEKSKIEEDVDAAVASGLDKGPIYGDYVFEKSCGSVVYREIFHPDWVPLALDEQLMKREEGLVQGPITALQDIVVDDGRPDFYTATDIVDQLPEDLGNLDVDNDREKIDPNVGPASSLYIRPDITQEARTSDPKSNPQAPSISQITPRRRFSEDSILSPASSPPISLEMATCGSLYDSPQSSPFSILSSPPGKRVSFTDPSAIPPETPFTGTLKFFKTLKNQSKGVGNEKITAYCSPSPGKRRKTSLPNEITDVARAAEKADEDEVEESEEARELSKLDKFRDYDIGPLDTVIETDIAGDLIILESSVVQHASLSPSFPSVPDTKDQEEQHEQKEFRAVQTAADPTTWPTLTESSTKDSANAKANAKALVYDLHIPGHYGEACKLRISTNASEDTIAQYIRKRGEELEAEEDDIDKSVTEFLADPPSFLVDDADANPDALIATSDNAAGDVNDGPVFIKVIGMIPMVIFWAVVGGVANIATGAIESLMEKMMALAVGKGEEGNDKGEYDREEEEEEE